MRYGQSSFSSACSWGWATDRDVASLTLNEVSHRFAQRSRNLIDVALHERAQKILAANRNRWRDQGLLEELPPKVEPDPRRMKQHHKGKHGDKVKFRIPKPQSDRRADDNSSEL